MEENEIQPQESSEGREGSESSERQKLDDATLDSRAFVEQTGNFHQAESVQDAFTSVVENAGDEVTPIVLPGLEPVLLQGLTATLQPVLQPEDTSAIDNLSGLPGDAGQSIVGSSEVQGGNEVTPISLAGEALSAVPINLPGLQGAAGQEAATVMGMIGEPEDQLAPVEMEGYVPSSLPGEGRVEPETGASSEVEGVASVSARQPGGSAFPSTTEERVGGPGSMERTAQTPKESTLEVGEAAVLETSVTPGEETEEVDLSEETLGEAEETWTPPDVYMYTGPDGKMIVVDANGKPVDCPPIVSSAEGISFFAYYPGMLDKDGEKITFEIQNYKGSLVGLYLGTDSSGKQIVVDSNGKPVDSPPYLFSPDGTSWYAAYPGSTPISDLMEDGDVVELQFYKGSLDGLYLGTDSSGKQIVVDANGKPVDSPPTVSTVDGIHFYAYYPGGVEWDELQFTVEIQYYQGSLKDLYLYMDSSGKQIVVDANGKPVDSPPYVFSSDGTSWYAAYPGAYTINDLLEGTVPPSEREHVAQLQSYKGSLDDLYLYVDSNGKQIVVDANGKPVDSPPTVTSPDGLKWYASYSGGGEAGDAVELQYYKPPSGKPTGGVSS